MMVRIAATKRSASLCCRAWLSGAPIKSFVRNEIQDTMMTAQMQNLKGGRVRPRKGCWRYIHRVVFHDTAHGRESLSRPLSDASLLTPRDGLQYETRRREWQNRPKARRRSATAEGRRNGSSRTQRVEWLAKYVVTATRSTRAARTAPIWRGRCFAWRPGRRRRWMRPSTRWRTRCLRRSTWTRCSGPRAGRTWLPAQLRERLRVQLLQLQGEPGDHEVDAAGARGGELVHAAECVAVGPPER